MNQPYGTPSFKSIHTRAFLCLAMVLVLASCAQHQAPLVTTPDHETPLQQAPQIKKTDKVALLLPLSGRHSALGQSMQKAAELSLFDHAGKNLNIAMYDTKSTPQGAQSAAQRAISENSGLILGPVFSAHVQGVSEAARRAGINVLSFSNNKSVAGAGVYALGFSPEDQIRAVLKYAAEHGKTSIAVMIPRNAYGALIEQQITRLQAPLSLTVDFIPYSLDANQLIKDLNPLRTMTVDALFIPEGGRALSQIISAILYQEISLDGIQLLGTGQWDDKKVFDNPTLHGAWIASSNPQERFMFNAKYKTAYGDAPNRLATLAYDALSMLAVLRRHHGDQAFSSSSLTQSRGFDGVDGVFRLTQGGMAERKLAILSVTPKGLIPLQPAKTSF